MGVCRRLSQARLLNRSGFRFVTFFEGFFKWHLLLSIVPHSKSKSHKILLSYLSFPFICKSVHSIRSVPTLLSFTHLPLRFSIVDSKKCAKPSCILQRSFPCFLILRQHSPLPPSLNSQSARAHRQSIPSIIKFHIHS